MKVKSVFTLLLLSVSLGLCAVIACADSRAANPASAWNAPDSTVTSIIGNRLSALLAKPKKVELYNVVYRDSAHINNTLAEADFVLDTLICKLNKEQISTLRFILTSDRKNYSIDTLAIPMIPHRPMYAFDFKGKDVNAIVWYSPGDFSWGIRYDGRDLFYYNVAYPEIINRFCSNLSTH